MITRKQLIKKYLDFFKSKEHKEIPNASLIPENDPTVLFTTAGMHPLVPYLLGQKHPLGKRLCNVQKCIRTGDIDEVGDKTHHTFFEMLGNWSLGDYFKEDAIKFSFEFLTKVLKIPKEKLSVTCFKGNKDAPKDTETEKIWKALGIKKIKFLGKKDNWWGPAGNTGLCGPDTEMFVNNIEIWNDVFMEYIKKYRDIILVDANKCLIKENKTINKDLMDFLTKLRDASAVNIMVVTNVPKEEIKTILHKERCKFPVYTLEKSPSKNNPEYFEKLIKRHGWEQTNYKERIIYFDHKEEHLESAKKAGIKLTALYKKNNLQIIKWIKKNLPRFLNAKQKNIDTGMGVERALALLQGTKDNYQTEVFKPLIKQIEKLSGKKYGKDKEDTRAMRIIADHIKASVFILAEDITPSNTEQGYVLRRLIRKAIMYGKKLGIETNKDITTPLTKEIIKIYSDYSELKEKKQFIIDELNKEEDKFEKTLEKGINKFEKIIKEEKKIDCKDAFLLYQSFGFPIELTKELAQSKKIKVDEKGFAKECKIHQELSRTASAGKFKSGLADQSEKTTKLHTATHLLLAALRNVLKDKNIIQKGSNITPERLRFDFNFPRKLTKEEIKKIEDSVNAQIQKSCEVKRQEMSPAEARKKGAMGIFDKKYGEKVSVYTIGDFSKEICAGPHVKNTCELGKFKIIKEESSSAGVRRIKAVLK